MNDDLIFDEQELKDAMAKAKALVDDMNGNNLPDNIKQEYGIIQAHISSGWLNIKRLDVLESLILKHICV